MKLAAIPVAHTQYRVVFTKKRPVVDGDECQGVCDYNKQTITIWQNPNPRALRACLFHEWMHALFHELGREEAAEDEALVEAIAQAVMRLRTEVPSL